MSLPPLSRTNLIAGIVLGVIAAGGVIAFTPAGPWLRDVSRSLTAAISNTASADTVWLASMLEGRQVTAKNAAGKDLPRRTADIPLWQGSRDYGSGSIVAAPGQAYGAASVAGARSMVAVPPIADNDFLTATFMPRLASASTYRLVGALGLASYAPAGTRARVAIYTRASATGERTRIFEQTIEAGRSYPIAAQLPETQQPIVEVVITKYGADNYFQGVVLDDLRLVPGGKISLVALSPTLEVGKATSLKWRATGVDSCTGIGFPAQTLSGRYIVRPTETTTYTLSCTGPSGEVRASATVQVMPTPTSQRVLLGSLLARQDTTVVNAAGQPLPKTYAAIPTISGSKDFSKGSMIPTSAGTGFGRNEKAGSESLVVTPPTANGDYLTASFPVGNVLDQSVSWSLVGSIGLAAYAPPGTKTNVAFYAGSDRGRTLLYEAQLEAGKTYPLDLPLSHWQGAGQPSLVIVVTKYGANNYNQGLVLSALNFVPGARVPDPKPTRGPVHSIARSNLAWEPPATQNKVITALSDTNFAWFRDNIRSSALAPTFATLFKRIQAQGKKILVVVTQDIEDYRSSAEAYAHAGSAFNQKCGWPSGALRLSTVDLDRFEARLEANLSTFKSQKVRIDAFEIGNEFDWVCFNGDLPMDRTVGERELMVHARAYARFLDRAVTVIKRHYPNATIVSHGAANGTGANLPGMMVSPGKLIALLKDIDGVNYQRKIDILGLHLYPGATAARSAGAHAERYVADTGMNLPVWVTEWGYRRSEFSNPATARYNAFLDTHTSVTASSARIENMFYYALDSFYDGYTIVDENYKLLPEARFFNESR